jgi:ribosomal protein S21
LIIERREGESHERLVARFRQMVQRAGILREIRRRRHFVSKAQVRRLAQAKAIRRARKRARKDGGPPGAPGRWSEGS